MKTVSLYDDATGYFVDQRLYGDEAFIVMNLPAGLSAMGGEHDPLSRRVDLETGEVIDWQPPQPPGDEFITYVWDVTLRRWAPVATVAGHRRRLADEVNRLRAAALQARRVTATGIAYRIVNDRANLETVLTGRAALGVPPQMTTDWRDDDNVMHSLDGPALAAFVGQMLPLGQAIYDHSWALKDALDAAATHEALDAIDLTAGWPT